MLIASTRLRSALILLVRPVLVFAIGCLVLEALPIVVARGRLQQAPP